MQPPPKTIRRICCLGAGYVVSNTHSMHQALSTSSHSTNSCTIREDQHVLSLRTSVPTLRLQSLTSMSSASMPGTPITCPSTNQDSWKSFNQHAMASKELANRTCSSPRMLKEPSPKQTSFFYVSLLLQKSMALELAEQQIWCMWRPRPV